LSNNRFFAERASKLNLEPIIDTRAMKLMFALQLFDHLASFELFNANCAVGLLHALFIILK
jgi:hypothetical protein